MTQPVDPHPVPDEDPEAHIGDPIPDPWEKVVADSQRDFLDIEARRAAAVQRDDQIEAAG